MFTRKTQNLTIDGVELVLVELSKKASFQIEAITDSAARVAAMFKAVVCKSDGSPFFINDEQIDDLPSSVVGTLGKAIRELHSPKA